MQPLQSATVILLMVLIDEAQNVIASDCGRRLDLYYNRIIKGSTTYHWPWHAAIYHRVKSLPEYRCGGTLINANSVLTAGHCISKSNKPLAPSIVSVSLGRLNLDVNETSAQFFEVIFIFSFFWIEFRFTS